MVSWRRKIERKKKSKLFIASKIRIDWMEAQSEQDETGLNRFQNSFRPVLSPALNTLNGTILISRHRETR